jgi:DNA-directed RNA polymerase subunit RPC12/RpoP
MVLMVPTLVHYALVRQTMQLVEITCRSCGRRRVLPRDVRIEKVTCSKCGGELLLKRVPVK